MARYYGRRPSRPYKRRRVGRTPYQIGRKVRLLDRKVRDIINSPELKYSDIDTSETLTNIPDVYFPFKIAQGDTLTTRDGNEIHATSIRINLWIDTISQTSYADSSIVICLYRIKNPSGLVFNSGEDYFNYIYDTVGSSYKDSNLYSHYNFTNMGNFEIVWEKRLLMNGNLAANNVTNVHTTLTKRYYKKFKINKKIRYVNDNDGDNLSEYENNAYILMLRGDQMAANYPGYRLNIRAFFKDV